MCCDVMVECAGAFPLYVVIGPPIVIACKNIDNFCFKKINSAWLSLVLYVGWMSASIIRLFLQGGLPVDGKLVLFDGLLLVFFVMVECAGAFPPYFFEDQVVLIASLFMSVSFSQA